MYRATVALLLCGMLLPPALARSLSGVVTGEDGTPFADARVVAAYSGPRRPDGDRSHAYEAITSTDESGRFVFVGLPPSTYKVRASAPGHYTHEIRLTEPEFPNPTLAFTLDAAAIVRGHVDDPAVRRVWYGFWPVRDRLPPDGAWRIPTSDRSAAVDDSGGFEIVLDEMERRDDWPPYRRRASFRARGWLRPEGYEPTALPSLTVQRGTPTVVAIREPRRSARVDGVLLDETGRPRANTSVRLLGVQRRARGVFAETLTDADGRFVFGDVPRGIYGFPFVRAEDPEAGHTEPITIEVRDPSLSVVLRTRGHWEPPHEPPETTELVLLARDASGAPMANVDVYSVVHVLKADGGWRQSRAEWARTDTHGRWSTWPQTAEEYRVSGYAGELVGTGVILTGDSGGEVHLAAPADPSPNAVVKHATSDAPVADYVVEGRSTPSGVVVSGVTNSVGELHVPWIPDGAGSYAVPPSRDYGVDADGTLRIPNVGRLTVRYSGPIPRDMRRLVRTWGESGGGVNDGGWTPSSRSATVAERGAQIVRIEIGGRTVFEETIEFVPGEDISREVVAEEGFPNFPQASGTVRYSDGGTVAGGTVVFGQGSGRHSTWSQQVGLDADGRFSTTRLRPGRWSPVLYVDGLPPQERPYVTVPDGGLHDMELLLHTGGSVHGLVLVWPGVVYPARPVVVLGQDRLATASARVERVSVFQDRWHNRSRAGGGWPAHVTAIPDAALGFAFHGVPPGEYHISLWDEASPDGSRAARLVAPPTPVTVRDAVAQKVELRVKALIDVELAVFDGDTREAIPDVEVRRGNRRIAATDANGVARFRYFVGAHEVEVTAHNERGRVYDGETVQLNISDSDAPKRVGVALYARPD